MITTTTTMTTTMTTTPIPLMPIISDGALLCFFRDIFLPFIGRGPPLCVPEMGLAGAAVLFVVL